MKYLELSDNEVINYLSNEDIVIGQGIFGLLCEYNNDSLLKLYYKEFYKAYEMLDIEEFRKDMNINLKLMKYDMDASSRKQRLENLYHKLQNTSSKDLIEGIILNRNYVIGVILKYYKNYYNLIDYYNKLSNSSKIIVLKRIRELFKELIDNNIYPSDIHERNIIINNNLDVKLIDLDGYEVRVEDKKYIERYPYIIKSCDNKIIDMEYRLKNNYSIIV